ncbi:xylose ABC transporter ATP-binding protein [Blautia schinkii]|nr:xylose ABC transporter ATP-binding protein [Blautia schinkii]
MSREHEYILEMQHITKEFPGVKALDDVNFCVKKGEIHALVGENGAGKSTLMKIMSGVYPHGSYSGDIRLSGEIQKYSSIKDSEKAGVTIIYQELGLVHSMNVCENIFLGNEIMRNGRIDWDQQFRLASKALRDVKLDIDPYVEVGGLGTGVQQLIEIAKALSKNVKLLILDEPTASLTEEDSENLLNLMKDLKNKGITCIFISHKLKEVFSICDTITVLRDGKTVVTKPASEMKEEELITYMVGRELKELFPRQKHTPGQTVLEIHDWSAENPNNPEKKLLNNINISIRKGEILGIAGLMGAGRTELALSIYGALDAKVTGELVLNGKKFKPFTAPKQAIKEGIGYLSEDRKRYGLVLSSSIITNMSLASLDKLTKGGVIDRDLEVSKANESVKKYHVKTPSIYQLAENLSGGNQQKVLLAKSILAEPAVLILDEPTRGIDVGAKYEIYQLMNELVEQGICVVMISSELPEVIGISDRIYIMHEGCVSGELEIEKDIVTQDKLLYFMAGGGQYGQA